MKKWYHNRSFIVSCVILLICLSAILIYANIVFIANNIINFLTYGFGVLGIVTTLYNYYRRFHLWVTRIKIILLNSNATWNVSAVFDGDFDNSILATIKKRMMEFEKETEFFPINNTSFQSFSKGLTMYVEYTDICIEDRDGIKGHLVVRVRDYNASYNLAIETLDEMILPVMNLITHETKPVESKYSFKIHFGKTNPFMGLAVKNIDKAALADFSFMYNKTIGISNRNVRVSKKGLECTTNTLTDFQSASGNFLSLVGN